MQYILISEKGGNMKLFVYGTLKKGFRLHYYLGDAKFIKKTELKGYDMYKVNCMGLTFPYIVQGNGTVKGELYEVSEKVFKRIEKMEKQGGLKKQKLNGIYFFVLNEKYRKQVEEVTRGKIESGEWK